VFEIYIHPDDAQSEALPKVPEKFTPNRVVQFSMDEYRGFKAMIAPNATDEEFWPKGVVYIVEVPRAPTPA
jgi:hypothetical protein